MRSRAGITGIGHVYGNISRIFLWLAARLRIWAHEHARRCCEHLPSGSLVLITSVEVSGPSASSPSSSSCTSRERGCGSLTCGHANKPIPLSVSIANTWRSTGFNGRCWLTRARVTHPQVCSEQPVDWKFGRPRQPCRIKDTVRWRAGS